MATTTERTPLLSSVSQPANGNGGNGDANSRARRAKLPSTRRILRSLGADADPDRSQLPLLLQCFVAGLSDAMAYSRTKTWVAFMTGNLTQLVISITALVFSLVLPTPSRREQSASHLDRVQSSSASVLAFALGCAVCQALASRTGNRHRGRLVATALARAAVSAAVLAGMVYLPGFQLGKNAWVLTGLAFNMGLQAVSGQRLGSAPFATTVVFTATLAQVMSDPTFPLLSHSGRWRLASIASLVAGGAVAQSLLELFSPPPAAATAASLVGVGGSADALVVGRGRHGGLGPPTPGTRADAGVLVCMVAVVGSELALSLAWLLASGSSGWLGLEEEQEEQEGREGGASANRR